MQAQAKSCTCILLVAIIVGSSCGPTTVKQSVSTPRPLAITTQSLPEGEIGEPYFAQLTAEGGARPYTWAIVSGELPVGLSLNEETGAIEGTPRQSGTAPITVRVADSSLLAQQSSLVTLEIEVQSDSLHILTRSLPMAGRTLDYFAQFAAKGGTPPYTWSIIEGGLPPGLNLDPITGKITGMATEEGEFSFTVQVEDSSAPPAIAVLHIGPRAPARSSAVWRTANRARS